METEKRRAYKKAWNALHKEEHRAKERVRSEKNRREKGIEPRKLRIDPFPDDLDISKL